MIEAPTPEGDFIHELCIALEHRWKPGALFMLLTAYFDESDTHGPAPTLIMAALLGNSRQWEIFGRRCAYRLIATTGSD